MNESLSAIIFENEVGKKVTINLPQDIIKIISANLVYLKLDDSKQETNQVDEEI
jgi:hypothetical protein